MTKKQTILLAAASFLVGVTLGILFSPNKANVTINGDNNNVKTGYGSYNGCNNKAKTTMPFKKK